MNLDAQKVEEILHIGNPLKQEKIWKETLDAIIKSSGVIPLALWETVMNNSKNLKVATKRLCGYWGDGEFGTKLRECFGSSPCIIARPVEEFNMVSIDIVKEPVYEDAKINEPEKRSFERDEIGSKDDVLSAYDRAMEMLK
jgi:hypothetical protein